MKRCLLLAATAAAALAGGHAAHAQVLNTWVQYGVSGNALLRSISSNTGSGSVCPTASVDGKHVSMVERFVPDSTFPILECEASVAIGGKQAIIAGVPLKMPAANPKRIVVVGDTGCRIKGTSIQACNDPIAFPTQRIAYYVANYYPDAIIHVGDYYYRESPCPTGSTINCTGSPSGDNWASWNADWFTPAATLISAAPIAHTRGNHESCGRGQQGWYHLLDPFPYSPAAVACANGSTYDYEPPYTVKMGTTTLLMFDSSYANDSTASNSPTIISAYKNELSQILPTLSGNVIYVTHKPTYGLIQDVNGVVSGGDNDEQNVFSNGVPQPIKLLLSGHIHNYQAVQLTSSAYAPQLVIGNSGTLLDSDGVPTQELGATYQASPSTTATTVYTADLAEFGFAVLDTTATGYNGSVYDLNGDLLAHCAITLASRTLTCTQ